MAILNSCRPFSETKAIVDCSAILPALLLYNALQQTAIKLLLCFFPLLSSPPLEHNPAVQKSDAFLRHAISSLETKLLMWIA